jgi:DNA topoisomerase IB
MDLRRCTRRLHHTPAICRNSYIHPAVLGLMSLSAEELAVRLGGAAPKGPRGLRVAERRLLQLLEENVDPPERPNPANGKSRS